MDNDAEKLSKLVEGERTVMLTTTHADGKLVSRPMTILEKEGWVLHMVTQADNDVAKESDGRQVNVSVMADGTYVSLSGTGHIHRDLAEKKELWSRILEAYAGDAEDPNNVILEITVQSGEYWDSGNKVQQLAGFAKTVIAGEAPRGDHGTAQV